MEQNSIEEMILASFSDRDLRLKVNGVPSGLSPEEWADISEVTETIHRDIADALQESANDYFLSS